MPTNFLTGPRDGSTWNEWESELHKLTKQEIIDQLRELIIASKKKTLLPPLGQEGKPYTFLDAVSRGDAGHFASTKNWP
jgi:hypothetical protein